MGAQSRAWQVGAGEVLLPGFGWKAGQRQGESENRRNMDLFIGLSVALATIVSLWVPHKRAETPSRCCLTTFPCGWLIGFVSSRSDGGPFQGRDCLAGPQRKCKISSFHTERGRQHGKGDEACKAAETGRVRRALWASRGVG